MRRKQGKFLALFMASLLAVYAFLLFTKGGFYIGLHEGDTLHLLEILLRMEDGQWPHLDFVTPIGVLAFAPIAIFLQAGFGVGHSILGAQILVATVLFPAAWWVAHSRFRGVWAWLFGATILIYALALIYGNTGTGISISMHYNRWAWAVAFLAITLVILPPQRRESAMVDGVVIGCAMAVMAMIKATYFAAFVVPVIAGLMVRGRFRCLIWALGAGLLLMAAVTLWVGTPMLWVAYLRDLINVAGSQVRPQPGLSFGEVISAPAFVAGSLLAVGAVVVLRQAGRRAEGVILLLLVPGFFYVTYQNFGNDPQWLWILALCLVMLRPEEKRLNGFGWDVQKITDFLAVAAFAFALPGFVNLALSPLRHFVTQVKDYVPLLPGSGVHEDLQTYGKRIGRVDIRTAYDGPGTLFASLYDPTQREDQRVTFQGRVLPYCKQEIGMVSWFRVISNELANWPEARGKTFFFADLLSSYWLYADLNPLKGGAPWYYGDLSGIENADYLFVATCPMSVKTWKNVLDTLSAQDWIDEVKEVLHTQYYTIYSLPHKRPAKVDLQQGQGS